MKNREKIVPKECINNNCKNTFFIPMYKAHMLLQCCEYEDLEQPKLIINSDNKQEGIIKNIYYDE